MDRVSEVVGAAALAWVAAVAADVSSAGEVVALVEEAVAAVGVAGDGDAIQQAGSTEKVR